MLLAHHHAALWQQRGANVAGTPSCRLISSEEVIPRVAHYHWHEHRMFHDRECLRWNDPIKTGQAYGDYAIGADAVNSWAVTMIAGAEPMPTPQEPTGSGSAGPIPACLIGLCYSTSSLSQPAWAILLAREPFAVNLPKVETKGAKELIRALTSFCCFSFLFWFWQRFYEELIVSAGGHDDRPSNALSQPLGSLIRKSLWGSWETCCQYCDTNRGQRSSSEQAKILTSYAEHSKVCISCKEGVKTPEVRIVDVY